VVQVDDNTRVPRAFISDGQITLNLGLLATNKLDLGNDYISFQARFSGKTEDVWVPISAISAIFARETGAGMGFEVGDGSAGEAFVGETDNATDDTTDHSPHDKVDKSVIKVLPSEGGNVKSATPQLNVSPTGTDKLPDVESRTRKRLHLSIVK